jgi:hypothetical protein
MNESLGKFPFAGGKNDGPFVEFKSGGKVLAVRKEHAAAKVGIVVQFGIGTCQLFVHLQIECVAFLGAIEPHEQYMPATFYGYSGIFHDDTSLM